MSSTSPVVVAGRELTAEELAERAQYSNNRLNAGIVVVAERVRELFNFEVTPHYIRRNIGSRKLKSRTIRHQVCCSDRDLFDFIILSNPVRGDDSESVSA